ncbi:MAG: helix-turn-helix transcriptional regulator [Methylovulum sp.]|nr:helix-turn-helix transcriptional regulator [Methylovulum sp.]
MAEKQSKHDFSQLIGKRLREARLMNRLSLDQAAQRLGYQNDSQLSKLENGYGGRIPTLAKLMEAARLYGVSCDWLLGLTDDWDIDEHHDRTAHIVGYMFESLSIARKAEIGLMCKISRRVADMEKAVLGIADKLQETHDALGVFVRLNPEFETDMRGGAKLARCVDEGQWLAVQTRRMLKDFLLTDSAALNGPQHDWVERYGTTN